MIAREASHICMVVVVVATIILGKGTVLAGARNHDFNRTCSFTPCISCKRLLICVQPLLLSEANMCTKHEPNKCQWRWCWGPSSVFASCILTCIAWKSNALVYESLSYFSMRCGIMLNTGDILRQSQDRELSHGMWIFVCMGARWGSWSGASGINMPGWSFRAATSGSTLVQRVCCATGRGLSMCSPEIWTETIDVWNSMRLHEDRDGDWVRSNSLTNIKRCDGFTALGQLKRFWGAGLDINNVQLRGAWTPHEKRKRPTEGGSARGIQ